ncbi:MAG: glycosyltransferase family 2 protein [Candidatus Margulisbacteria bacterium]|nr:glycosyltransferase family 2 protein [Candidatus Margulisiibacteriota bacterium]MBU1617592.1 glycosyltransferase family 2 protein [Candidatus Margulisiibacteriota bacterium]
MVKKVELSIVLPVCDEAGNLPELFSRLAAVLRPLTNDYELILIDDGSRDDSWRLISEAARSEPRIKALRFSRNFGQMAALTAGLDLAMGDAIIMMDADLQHPPELLPRLIEKWRGGAEIVNTIRHETGNGNLFKRLTARVFYRLINLFSGLTLPAGAADFRLLGRKAADSLKGFREQARFLRGLVNWLGFRQEFIEYRVDKRPSGKSKYSLRKMAAFSLDGIFSFSVLPLRLAAALGLLVAAASFIYLGYTLYIRFFTDRAIEGWASVLGALLFIGGLQLAFLGLIGEYIGRIYEEAKQRPLYIVRERIGQ